MGVSSELAGRDARDAWAVKSGKHRGWMCIGCIGERHFDRLSDMRRVDLCFDHQTFSDLPPAGSSKMAQLEM